MPIITIQRRMAEQGRIRLGQKVTTSNGRSRPEKLDRFRFTSANERLINDIATLYGGQPKAWDNGGKAEHEVITDAKTIPVIVVKGGFSQWMETWSGGGCTHRCDGVTNALTGDPCDPDDRAHNEAKPTTRLSVMLRDVETLGVWRLESHGWNAAAELPMLAELAQHVGDLVPATLNLVERKAIKDGKTSRFVVPVLDLAVSKQRLVEIVGGQNGGPAQLEAAGASGALQIEGGPAARPDYEALIAAASTTEDLQTLWHKAGDAGHLTAELKARITDAARTLQPAAQDEPEPEEVEAELVDEPTPDAGAEQAWMAVVMVAGQNGWTTTQLTAAFEQYTALPVADASVEQIREFETELRAGRIEAA